MAIEPKDQTEFHQEKAMFISKSNSSSGGRGSGRVLVPLIPTAATLGFAVAPCSLGFVIIAVSEHLIRSIMVGDDPELLVSDLQNQFPHERIEAAPPDPVLLAKIVRLIDRTDDEPDLALDIRGSDFQSRVWEALRKVPAGHTVSYTFLAERIG